MMRSGRRPGGEVDRLRSSCGGNATNRIGSEPVLWVNAGILVGLTEDLVLRRGAERWG